MKKIYLKPEADCVKFLTLSVLNVSNYDNVQDYIDWDDADARWSEF